MKITVGEVMRNKADVRDYLSVHEDGRIFVNIEAFDKVLIDRTDEWDELRTENERLRKALEFYADSENYEIGFNYIPQMTIDCMVIDDGGHAARRALKGESE